MQHVVKNNGRLVQSHQSLILTAGLALQIELFKIERRMADFNAKHDGTDTPLRDNVKAQEKRHLTQELEDWKVVFDSIFPSGKVVNVVARYEFLD